jgi:pimeloyl-ACP methyl ester carboxylesterase
MTRIVHTADGRRLTVDERGDRNGLPVFLMHGTPGSRLGPLVRSTVLHRVGARLICFDRPGYGDSDRLPGRAVSDVAADVAAIADAYGFERFAVVGRSGGGPHALACAALLPERVIKAAVLVSLAPHNAEGLDWFAGMTPGNVEAYTQALVDPAGLAASIVPKALRIRDDPASLFDTITDGLSLSDLQVITDRGLRSLLTTSYAAAVSRSADGWIDDALAFCTPWGFDPADIAAPVLLWHGADDRFSPVSHTRWLAGRIRSATVAVQAGASHFSAFPVFPRVLSWLAGPAMWDTAA